jgi:hypothetical protein
MVHAIQALRLNWVAEEFSISHDTLVRVFLPDGSKVELPIAALYDICYGVE